MRCDIRDKRNCAIITSPAGKPAPELKIAVRLFYWLKFPVNEIASAMLAGQ